MQHLMKAPLAGSLPFLAPTTSTSSPGKVLRVASNWTTCSTACASPRQFLWVLTLRPYSPGGTLNALAAAKKGKPSFTQCPSFTARTTRVSNPVCSPSFRTSASGTRQSLAFASGVPPDIYAFHRFTRSSSDPSRPRARYFRPPFRR